MKVALGKDTLSASRRLRCTLAFFGIDRRLDLTGPIIERRIVRPAGPLFEISSVGFLWAPERIYNSRTGEDAVLTPPRFGCLPLGTYHSAPPLDLDVEPGFLQLKTHGDFWGDGFSSLGNLYSQLVSLHRTTELALCTEPDIVVFLRPDLLYHDSFAAALDRARRTTAPRIFLPHWQPHGGLNDRFALCRGAAAIRAYGQRIDVALDFCQTTAGSLHAEKLLRHALAAVPVERISVRASRVRVDGMVKHEDFSFRGWKPALRVFAGALRRQLLPRWQPRHGQVGLKSSVESREESP